MYAVSLHFMFYNVCPIHKTLRYPRDGSQDWWSRLVNGRSCDDGGHQQL